MKNGKKKFLNVMLTGIMASSVLTSYVIPKAYANTNSAESILKGLSEEQKQSIKRLTPQEGFIIDPKLLSLKEKTANVIVELNTSPVESTQQSVLTDSAKNKKKKIREEQEFFKNRLTELFKKKQQKQETKKESIPFEIKHTYENVFNGVAMTIPTNQINTLLETGVVKRIWKDNVITLPKIESLNEIGRAHV